VCWSRHLVSVHEVKPVCLSIAVRRVWQQFTELNPSIYSLVPPGVADVTVDCALCRQSNKPALLLLLLRFSMVKVTHSCVVHPCFFVPSCPLPRCPSLLLRADLPTPAFSSFNPYFFARATLSTFAISVVPSAVYITTHTDSQSNF